MWQSSVPDDIRKRVLVFLQITDIYEEREYYFDKLRRIEARSLLSISPTRSWRSTRIAATCLARLAQGVCGYYEEHPGDGNPDEVAAVKMVLVESAAAFAELAEPDSKETQ
jgi:hypothetical protein